MKRISLFFTVYSLFAANCFAALPDDVIGEMDASFTKYQNVVNSSGTNVRSSAVSDAKKTMEKLKTDMVASVNKGAPDDIKETESETPNAEDAEAAQARANETPPDTTPRAVSDEELSELKDNAAAMKEKENSMINKTLTTAAIGAAGYGVSQLLQGNAEKSADTAADQSMRAYLETFRCDYGQGKNHRGGEIGIEIPGGNVLFEDYQSYINLAASIHKDKELLGMKPGIESEVLADSATGGLYDNAGLGITGGAFASRARALLNPDGKDAEMLAQQSSDTQSRISTGRTAAIAGVAVGAVGNLLVNSVGQNGKNVFGQTVAQENSAAIKKKYDDAANKLKSEIAALPAEPVACPNGGTYPNCECGDRTYNENTNTCEIITPPANIVPQCTVTDEIIVGTDGTCSCADVAKKFVDGKCVEMQTTPVVPIAPPILHSQIKIPAPQPVKIEPRTAITMSNSQLFASGSYTLTTSARTAIIDFTKKLDGESNCIKIVGHTDRTGRTESNQTLSVNRANAVADAIKQANISGVSVVAVGVGETECETTTRTSNKECRKVTLTSTGDSCQA